MSEDLIFYTNGKETSRIPSPTLEDLTLGTKTPEIKLEIEKTMDCEPYPDEMFEEVERRERANELYQDALHELDNLAAGVDSDDFMNAYLVIQTALKVALGEEDI